MLLRQNWEQSREACPQYSFPCLLGIIGETVKEVIYKPHRLSMEGLIHPILGFGYKNVFCTQKVELCNPVSLDLLILF
jgi:hypothetical protein